MFILFFKFQLIIRQLCVIGDFFSGLLDLVESYLHLSQRFPNILPVFSNLVRSVNGNVHMVFGGAWIQSYGKSLSELFRQILNILDALANEPWNSIKFLPRLNSNRLLRVKQLNDSGGGPILPLYSSHQNIINFLNRLDIVYLWDVHDIIRGEVVEVQSLLFFVNFRSNTCRNRELYHLIRAQQWLLHFHHGFNVP